MRMTKKQIIENLASDIGIGVHTALRKYVDGKGSAEAWEAINNMTDGGWEDACRIAAKDIYTPFRKAIKNQLLKKE